MLGLNRDLLRNYKNDVGSESNYFAEPAWTNRWKLGKIEKSNTHETYIILTETRCCVSETKSCPSCGYDLPRQGRFCPKCGSRVDRKPVKDSKQEPLNLRILYIMVGLLILAVLFPPWQTPPEQAPEFLGFHFITSPPSEGAQRSPILQNIQLFTIAVAGLYFSWAFRGKG
ncbi:hypothetical protein [Candidatus Nitrospira allomarina]|jgi:hypothetical protein|uniref:Zinc ribbon domain-containing protein n=1 Tax=Candidatus Nitrospira allomarina TaxID=3020900 RepID=A0AA96GCG8_9BACT|nr:hypothetical protein [Candidatus Nitrospira allomarina]WNM59046.1 hypothetical protein PP769_04585 [Candidatus Nitrospira allomarina]